MNKQKQPLRCEVEDGRLVISIGINTLAWASKQKNGGPLVNRISVTDEDQWAKDVAREIEREDEIGESPLHRTLDSAIRSAADSGSEALRYYTAKD